MSGPEVIGFPASRVPASQPARSRAPHRWRRVRVGLCSSKLPRGRVRWAISMTNSRRYQNIAPEERILFVLSLVQEVFSWESAYNKYRSILHEIGSPIAGETP